MRRKQCEIIDTTTQEAILRRATVGRMASIGSDGYPYITPLNFVYWQGAIYFHCAHEGEKIENIRRDDRVCFEVDIPLAYLGMDYDRMRPTCQVHQFYHCIIIRGRAEVVTAIEEKTAALNALMISHEGGGHFIPVTAQTKAVGLCTVIAIRIDSMSGKSDLGQKMNNDEKKRVARYLHNRDLPGDREAASLMGGQ